MRVKELYRRRKRKRRKKRMSVEKRTNILSFNCENVKAKIFTKIR